MGRRGASGGAARGKVGSQREEDHPNEWSGAGRRGIYGKGTGSGRWPGEGFRQGFRRWAARPGPPRPARLWWWWLLGAPAPALRSASVLPRSPCLHGPEKGATTAGSCFCVSGLCHDFPSSGCPPHFPPSLPVSRESRVWCFTSIWRHSHDPRAGRGTAHQRTSSVWEPRLPARSLGPAARSVWAAASFSLDSQELVLE